MDKSIIYYSSTLVTLLQNISQYIFDTKNISLLIECVQHFRILKNETTLLLTPPEDKNKKITTYKKNIQVFVVDEHKNLSIKLRRDIQNMIQDVNNNIQPMIDKINDKFMEYSIKINNEEERRKFNEVRMSVNHLIKQRKTILINRILYNGIRIKKDISKCTIRINNYVNDVKDVMSNSNSSGKSTLEL